MHPYLTTLLAEARTADLRRQAKSPRPAHRRVLVAKRPRAQHARHTRPVRRVRRRLHTA